VTRQPDKSFIQLATLSSVRNRALVIGLIVGTILALVNHVDAALDGTFTTRNAIQILVTYLVPYGVSTYSSVSALKVTKSQ